MLRPLALRAARLVESGLERLSDRETEAPVLDPYLGYATPDALILRARVLTNLRRAEPDPEQSKWTNLRQMASLFFTDEVEGVPVTAAGVTGTSDAEGYVTLSVPRPAKAPARGWAEVPLALDGQPPVPCAVRVPGPEARHMVISDIDDTVIETGAHSLARNLWTTFTGSALTRQAHPDAIALLRALEDEGANPIFYVSSSPWNLHDFLEGLFAHEGVPRGPMFLRDLGLTDEGIGQGHGTHKGAAIDTILAANPGLPAILLGDSGQKDAQIYRDAVLRHPGRIRAVALREPAPGEGDDDLAAISAIETAGVPCYHGATFDGALTHWTLT